jgi:ABC-type transporter Mla subunit MlaD
MISSDAPIVKVGGTVRMAGQLAGTITEVEPDGENSRVTMELRPKFAPIGQDATALVRVRSIVYLTYIEIDPGDRGDPMPEGDTIPIERTGAGVDLLHVVDLFDERTRDLLARSVNNIGEGLAGRGEHLNEGLAKLNPALREGTPQIEAFTSQPGAIARGITGASELARGLRGERPDDVSALIGSSNEALAAIAARHAELGAGIAQLRPLEDELLLTAPLAKPVLADTAVLARELEPAAGALRAGLPPLARLLSMGRPLRTESALFAAGAVPLLKRTGPALYDLYPVAAALDPILTPLGSILDTIVPYSDDITLAGEYVTSATGRPYPQGQTAPDNPALRFVPIIGCHHARNPYPKPGEAMGDSARC